MLGGGGGGVTDFTRCLPLVKRGGRVSQFAFNMKCLKRTLFSLAGGAIGGINRSRYKKQRPEGADVNGEGGGSD